MDDYFPTLGYVPPPLVFDLERGILLLTNYPPGGTPARDPEPPAPPPFRYRERYGVVYCETCGLAVPYCKGHGRTTNSPPPISDVLGRANATKGTP